MSIQTPSWVPLDGPLYGASPGQAFIRFWRKGLTFSGRASRSEYWWATLQNALVVFGCAVLGVLSGRAAAPFFGVVYLVFLVLAVVPWTAVTVRRLHDAGLSGSFWLMRVVPVVGEIALLLLLASRPDTSGARFDPVLSATPSVPMDAPPLTTFPSRPSAPVPPPEPPASISSGPAERGAGPLWAAIALVGVGALALAFWGIASIPHGGTRPSAAAPPAPSVQPAQQVAPAPQSGPSATSWEDTLRAEIAATPDWQDYNSTMYFKWENGGCSGIGNKCGTVRIESIAEGGCPTGSVAMTLMNAGVATASSSADFYGLRQGSPKTIEVPFNGTLQGDKVRLDGITCR